MPDYFQRPRPEMLAFVPSTARRVLDLGCGAGVFGASLKQQQDLEVWGVELDPAAAATAADRLDHVLVGDVLQVLTDLPDATFDCVIMNDILEHLVDPEALLAGVRAKLDRAGLVVASIPNVRHFPHLWQLVIHGRWDYADEGILDRTHLRFFTRRSLEPTFRRCGYRLIHIQGIHPTRSWRFRAVNLVTLGRWVDMKYLQFACVAVPVWSEENSG